MSDAEDRSKARQDWAARRKSIRPRPISSSPLSTVTVSQFSPSQPLPLIIKARLEGLSLSSWAGENREFIEANLIKHGAILFRGFDVRTQGDFEDYLKSTSVPLMEYLERSTPRSDFGNHIYSSTEFPPDHAISLHNELSAAMTFPMKVWFCCLKPADGGGQTPIADVRNVLKRIRPDVRDLFVEKGWLLIRNYGDGLGLPWHTSFQTTQKAVVEEYCQNNAMRAQWKEGDRLRTYQVRPAVATHRLVGAGIRSGR